ncbi:hypothetical protein OK074_7603 [Actinobacteria bacterium OK074]|nr:hypothetical protein OK074_7603 [Actinobacteria bacterium OK074]
MGTGAGHSHSLIAATSTVAWKRTARLIEFAELPNTVLQIVPFSVGERRPFDLPLNILTMLDRSLMAYAESALRGHLERESSFVVPLLASYHQLQAEALSQAPLRSGGAPFSWTTPPRPSGWEADDLDRLPWYSSRRS